MFFLHMQDTAKQGAAHSIPAIIESSSNTMQFAAEMVGVQNTEQWKKYASLSEETKLRFKNIAAEYNVPEAYILGICYNESKFNPGAINDKNTDGTTDWGIGQCNDTTLSCLSSLIGITSMSEVLNEETGIRACCALFRYYKDEYHLLLNTDALLAYQEGYGNYLDVKEGREEPWSAYEKVLKNVHIYQSVLNCYNAMLTM